MLPYIAYMDPMGYVSSNHLQTMTSGVRKMCRFLTQNPCLAKSLCNLVTVGVGGAMQ